MHNRQLGVPQKVGRASETVEHSAEKESETEEEEKTAVGGVADKVVRGTRHARRNRRLTDCPMHKYC